MSQFDVKMTELADAIKVKNPTVASRLSVQGMIDAVNGITIESAGGVDVSGVTATAADVLNTVKFVDSSGNLINGAMPIIEPIVSGSTVVLPKGYNAEQRNITVEQGHGVDLFIYRCTEYDNGEAIPAYSNINISSAPVASANGVYTLSDRNTTAGNRVWMYGKYRIGYDTMAQCWCLYDSSACAVAYSDLALAKAPCWITDNSGTLGGMINWYDVVSDDSDNVTKFLDTKTIFSSTYPYGMMYFVLKLKAGVEYTIGMSKGTIYGTQVWLVDKDGNWIDNWYNTVTAGGVSVMGKQYTPDTDEMLYIAAGYATSQISYQGTFQMHCYPAPEVIDDVNEEPWQCTWTPSVTMTSVAVAERPATGVKMWSGYEGSQNPDTKEWSFSDTIKTDLIVDGITPEVGKTYTADSTLQIANAHTAVPAGGKMVALFHMDVNAYTVVDATETCMLCDTNQCNPGNTDQPKFGKGCFGYNYMQVNDYQSGYIQWLPELDAFTVEFWHYYAGYYNKIDGPLLIVQNPDNNYGDYGVTWLSMPDFPQSSEFYIAKRYFHHALVREAGSEYVTEYIDGKPAAMHKFTPKLGGDRKVWVRAGGFEPGQSGDVRNYLDELAIFNYAKYHGQFDPPTSPYPDVKSGLRGGNEPREVKVSGLDGIIFANDPSYAMVNKAATGTSRQWITADGQWYLYFDWDGNYCWVIANKTSAWDDGYICAARLNADYDIDQSAEDFDPIDHPDWIDNMTNKSIKVERLRDPMDGEIAVEKLTLSGAGDESVNGVYKFKKNALTIQFGNITTEADAYEQFGGDCYLVHFRLEGTSYTENYDKLHVVKYDNLSKILYTIPLSGVYGVPQGQVSVVSGTAPAPSVRLGG